MSPERDEIIRLFNDAVARGMSDLAMAYAFAAIRMGREILDRQMNEIKAKQK